MTRVGVISLGLGGLLAVGLVILAVSGRPVGLGTFSSDVNGELVMFDAVLLGLGAGVLSWRPPRRMADRYARASWAVLFFGCFAMVLSGLAALRLHGSDPLSDWPSVLFGLAGLLLFPIGALLVVVALIRAAVGSRPDA
jgi:hypothetical protein